MTHPHRLIPDEMWRQHFHKLHTSEKRTRYDGEKFEKLALDVLNHVFGKGWEHVGGPHDGAKDFVLKPNMWAECKAYSTNLSYHAISPTMVMALLNKPETLVILSRSPLNEGAVNVLVKYQRAAGVQVVILDGDSLDHIIASESAILDKHFGGASLRPVETPACIVLASRTSDLHIHPKDDDFLPIEQLVTKDPLEINLHGGVRVDILLRNLSPFQDARVVATHSNIAPQPPVRNSAVEQDHPHDKGALEILRFAPFMENDDEDGGSGANSALPWTVQVNIPKSSMVLLQFMAKAKRPGVINLPTLSFEGKVHPAEAALGAVRIKGLYEVPLVGARHKALLSAMTTAMQERRKSVLIRLTGKSGVGKSRLLEELASKAVVLGRQCLKYDMSSGEADKSAKVARELLVNLYDMPLVESQVDEGLEAALTGADDAGHKTILQTVYDKHANIFEDKEVLTGCLAKKLRSRRFALLIDNMQDASDDLAEVLHNVLKTIREPADGRAVVVLCFNVELFQLQSKAKQLHDAIEVWNRGEGDGVDYRLETLPEFSKEDVDDFLREAIVGPNDDGQVLRNYQRTFRTIKGDDAGKPLHLWLTLQHLVDTDALRLEGHVLKADATTSRNLQTAIQEFPTKLRDALDIRWKKIKSKADADGLDVSQLVWTVKLAYALSEAPAGDDKILKLEARTTTRLVLAGLFRETDDGEVRFFHQRYFQYFKELYSNDIAGVANEALEYIEHHDLRHAKHQQDFILRHAADRLEIKDVEFTLAQINSAGLERMYGPDVCRRLHAHLLTHHGQAPELAFRGYVVAGEWLKRLDTVKSALELYKATWKTAPLTAPFPGQDGVSFFRFAIDIHLAAYEDSKALELSRLALDALDRGLAKDLSDVDRELAEALVSYRQSAIRKGLYELDEAIAQGQRALEVFQRHGRLSDAADTLFDLAEVQLAREETHEDGLESIRNALAIHERDPDALGDPALYRVHLNRAKLLIHQGRFEEAAAEANDGAWFCEAASNAFWGTRCRMLEAMSHLLHAHAQPSDDKGREQALARASTTLQRAQDSANVSAVDRAMADLAYLHGKYCCSTGDVQQAFNHFMTACKRLNRQTHDSDDRDMMNPSHQNAAGHALWNELIYIDMACETCALGGPAWRQDLEWSRIPHGPLEHTVRMILDDLTNAPRQCAPLLASAFYRSGDYVIGLRW